MNKFHVVFGILGWSVLLVFTQMSVATPLYNDQSFQLTTKVDSPVVEPPLVVEEKEEEHIMCGPMVNEAMPVGGYINFYRYINQNLKYPARARRMGIEGKVYLQFIVEKDGSLIDIKVVRGLGSGCDKEAIRLLKRAPKWIPAKYRGKLVRVQRYVPIRFLLR